MASACPITRNPFHRIDVTRRGRYAALACPQLTLGVLNSLLIVNILYFWRLRTDPEPLMDTAIVCHCDRSLVHLKRLEAYASQG